MPIYATRQAATVWTVGVTASYSGEVGIDGHRVPSDGYRLTVLVGCDEGPCPKIGFRAARPGHRLVQGARIPDSERDLLGHEDMVEVPDEILLDYARRLRDEGRL
jgi:hypothetical protein